MTPNTKWDEPILQFSMSCCSEGPDRFFVKGSAVMRKKEAEYRIKTMLPASVHLRIGDASPHELYGQRDSKLSYEEKKTCRRLIWRDFSSVSLNAFPIDERSTIRNTQREDRVRVMVKNGVVS
jgi:hypothetical protein